jgi:hypothetical protein
LQEVAEFERLCFELYESGDPARVAEAHKVLHALDEDPSCIPRCRAVIEFSEVFYVGMVFSPWHYYYCS